MNCLIGPGDATKTTILDAIELCLNPRSYIFADDCDFYDLNVKQPIRITITLAVLPPHFKLKIGAACTYEVGTTLRQKLWTNRPQG